MKLTPLYQALIFIENNKQASLEDLSFMPKAVLRGILGKMEAMKLVEAASTNSFKISVKGQALLNKFLDNLHRSTIHWDKKWRLVSFSIPESKRPLRDKFRREIEAEGLRMILTGLWITPLPIVSRIENIAKEKGLFSNIIICETDSITTGVTHDDLVKLWGFEESRREIYSFIKDAEEYLASKEKSSFETKKMIFRYALILENQPKLPIELFPADWPQFRANLIYKKIRRLLNV